MDTLYIRPWVGVANFTMQIIPWQRQYCTVLWTLMQSYKLLIIRFMFTSLTSDLCLWELGPLITPKQWSSKTAREISPNAWEISPNAWGICETVGYCSREWQLCSDSADVTSQSYDLSRAPWRPGSIAYGLKPHCTPLLHSIGYRDRDLLTSSHPTCITRKSPKQISTVV